MKSQFQKMNRLLIAVLLALCTMNSFGQLKDGSKVKLAVDWEKYLAKQDLVWKSLKHNSDTVPAADGAVYPKSWNDGSFLGNGLLGMMVYKHSDQVMRFQLGRTDVTAHFRIPNVDWMEPRVPIGDFYLTPKGKIKSESMRLDLWNAEARGVITTNLGEIRWRALVHATTMLMAIETECTGGESATVNFVPEWGASPRLQFVSKELKDKAKVPPLPKLSQEGDIHLSLQKLTEKGEFATAWKEINLSTKRKLYVVNISNSYPGQTAHLEAVEAIRYYAKKDWSQWQASHRAWWHNYYPQSFVTFPDHKWESFYWIQLYKLGSATRSNSTVIDVVGPWMPKTPWPGTWWNLNVQLSYSPVYTSNHLSLGESLTKTMFAAANTLHDNVPFDSLKGRDIAYMGRVSSLDMKCGGRGIFELGNLTWLLHNAWRQYAYSMNDSMMQYQLFPLLKSTINLYLAIMKKGSDGKWHLPPSHSPEYKNNLEVPDANYSLMLFRWGTQVLLDANNRYQLNDPLSEKWKDVMANLTDFPTNENGYMVGAGQPFDYSHRHYSHLFSIFPLYTVNCEQPENVELINLSIKHWINFTGELRGFSFTGATSMAAAIGDGNTALTYLNGLVPYLQPNTMYTELGPCIETPISAAESMLNMMLQSWNKKIRVFPAVPDKWKDAAFYQLRTEGAFLVSAQRKNGKTQWIAIKSEAGEPCKLKVPDGWQGLELNDKSKHTKLTPLNKSEYLIDLKKGEQVVVVNKGNAGQSVVIVSH